MKLKIALLQLLPTSTLKKQLQKGIKECQKAHEEGADVVLFPEMWSIGYNIFQDEQKLQEEAKYIPVILVMSAN